jgi:hypothetical protein
VRVQPVTPGQAAWRAAIRSGRSPPHAGRNYASRGARCITFRSREVTVRNTPAGRCARVCAFVTSDGIGTDGCGATEPLCVTSDGGGTDGCGATEPLCVTSDGIGGTDGFGGTEPLGDGRGRVVAGLGSGRGAAGSGMVSSLGICGPAAASSAAAGQRPTGTLRRGMHPSGTGIASRDAALRASWALAIAMTASVRMSSSGSPGKLAAGGG